jgi:hypothetical protein
MVANRCVAWVWRFVARSARRGFVGPTNDGGLARQVAVLNLSIREPDGGEDGPRRGPAGRGGRRRNDTIAEVSSSRTIVTTWIMSGSANIMSTPRGGVAGAAAPATGAPSWDEPDHAEEDAPCLLPGRRSGRWASISSK